MTKSNATSRRSRPAAEEEGRVTSAGSRTQEEQQPRVKRIAEEKAPEPERAPEPPKAPERVPEAPKVRVNLVELVEGSTYEIRGVRFLRNRPVVVTDQRILSAVEVNSRFRVTDAEGGKR